MEEGIQIRHELPSKLQMARELTGVVAGAQSAKDAG